MRLRLGRRRSEDEPLHEEAPAEEPLRERQPSLYAKLVLLVATTAYVTAFVLENRKQVTLHFVFGTSRVSLIWLILLSLALGLLCGVLLSQLYRRRRRRH
ncbi:MAG: lipopolysaccharide assembly protein LapA domain-containing protein [Gaiellaceae bacterium]